MSLYISGAYCGRSDSRCKRCATMSRNHVSSRMGARSGSSSRKDAGGSIGGMSHESDSAITDRSSSCWASSGSFSSQIRASWCFPWYAYKHARLYDELPDLASSALNNTSSIRSRNSSSGRPRCLCARAAVYQTSTASSHWLLIPIAQYITDMLTYTCEAWTWCGVKLRSNISDVSIPSKNTA